MSPAKPKRRATYKRGGIKKSAAKSRKSTKPTRKAANSSARGPSKSKRPAIDYPKGKGFSELKAEDRFEIALAVQATVLDDEIVILDPLTNQGFRANNTGTQIWSGVGRHRAVGEIAKELAERYGLPAKYAEEITENFLEDMRAKGLIAKIE